MTANVSIGESLAINGGRKTVTLPAPRWPESGEWEQELMREVVASGKWSWLGEHELRFAEEFAEFLGARYCIPMANGTVTMQCALQAFGVVPGDEVIVPGLTWVATAQAALDVGADVVFADIDPETLCLSPAAVEAAVTPKTKAIVPVHLYGCMCDMDALTDIANRHGLKVLEDTAHQHGGRWRNRAAGTIGDAGSFSFQQSKVLTCGEGGAVVCDDPEVFRTVFTLKQVGWSPAQTEPLRGGAPPRLVPGGMYAHNYRITEMQAVLLRGGLKRLADQTRRREEAAAFLAEGLARIGGPLQAVPRDPRAITQAYYAMTLRFDPALAEGLNKRQYLAALQAEGVGMADVYAPVYRSPLLNLGHRTSPVPFRKPPPRQDYAALRLPGVEKAVGETALILPHQHLLGNREYLTQLLNAAAKVNSYLKAAREFFAARK